MRYIFWFGDRCLGEMEASTKYHFSRSGNEVYYCPVCGNCWGSVKLDKPKWWQYINRPCPEHKSFDPIYGGSLLDPVHWKDTDLYIDNPNLPPDLIRYEFNRVLSYLQELTQ